MPSTSHSMLDTGPELIEKKDELMRSAENAEATLNSPVGVKAIQSDSLAILSDGAATKLRAKSLQAILFSILT